MGLFDRVRSIFSDADERQGSDPEDLLDISSAAFTMKDIGYELIPKAALCFHAPDGFETTLDELQSIVDATGEEKTEVREDSHGFRWLIVEDTAAEGLATALQFSAETFLTKGAEDELLAAVFGFEKDHSAYLIYSFERGRFYPFVPEGTEDRDMQTEFKIQGVLREEIPIEDDESEWYPLWPDRPGKHPWE
ncbi:hypothetical protein K0C01_04655 [Salinarchaeum sp. IM2453]|uniref:PspA-associated protein PspAB n=1 Tax=Salinarchaeum sp. IM2453 TaxID=2862870 RepID=UPI001C8359AA|nr:hypothetical protein [Salinarchaeum sp. IM2453]QZA89432.1 hypothetical protein K0C01_04655 [Salinarchaeum sp. IM2453]